MAMDIFRTYNKWSLTFIIVQNLTHSNGVFPDP